LVRRQPIAESIAECRRLVDEPPQPFRLGDGPAPVTVDEPAFAPQPFRRGEADEPLSNPPDSSPR